MKRYMVIIVCALLCVANTISCTDLDKQRFHLTLKQAGNYKGELGRALAYYSREEDSLKRKAMCFLLEHMHAHHAYCSERMKLANRAISIMDTLMVYQTNPAMSRYADFRLFASLIDSVMDDEKVIPEEELEKLLDSHTVTANFLIQNVEFAFRAWKMNAWSKNVDFDTFCEYVLPYRLQNEHIELWRPQFYYEYSRKAGKYRNVIDMERACHIAGSLHTQQGMEAVYSYNMNISAVSLLQFGRCFDIGRYQVMALRSIGIPATMDYVPHWGNYTGNHGMVKVVPFKQPMLIDNCNTSKNISVLFGSASFLQGRKVDIGGKGLPEGIEVQYSKTIPKVYRYTWSVQPEMKHLINIARKGEMIPDFLSCVKDVTGEYVVCSDAWIRMSIEGHRIGYLCVFERGELVPVACSEIKEDGQVLFRNMGRHVMYLPAVYEQERMIPAGFPFYLDERGKMNTLCADTTHAQDIRLLAKYPYFSYTATHASKLIGGIFDGSNQEDCKSVDSLATIREIPYYRQLIDIKTKKKYRYVRFTAPQEKGCCIAELSFYTINAAGDTILLPPPTRFYDGVKWHYLDVLKDGKYGKYYSMYTNHLVADLGSAYRLTHIELVPRSNTNGIIPGNKYELFYWDGKKGWTSLGKQDAEDWCLTYYQAPTGALFWLKCYGRGKEERIFTIKEGGKQQWW